MGGEERKGEGCEKEQEDRERGEGGGEKEKEELRRFKTKKSIDCNIMDYNLQAEL